MQDQPWHGAVASSCRVSGWRSLDVICSPGRRLDAVIRQQLAPSRYCRPRLPERYRVAGDLAESLAAVVAVAEQDASTLGEASVPLDRLV
jgi:hypothetical protein